jgi:hypothetical protein
MIGSGPGGMSRPCWSTVPAVGVRERLRGQNRHRVAPPGAVGSKAAALAMFPGGTVNRVLQLSEGSYAVHIISTTGPHHVFISTDFQVTGAA